MTEGESLENVITMLRNMDVWRGLHSRIEERFLWNAGRALSSGTVVEIGSLEGYSTIILAKALGRAGEVYAIDPHAGLALQADESFEGVSPSQESTWPKKDTWSRFIENIGSAGVSDVVKPMKMKSEDAARGWTKKIQLLFIDGSHRYEDVRKDFLLWRPHLAPGALLIFHDCWISGVYRVIRQYVLQDTSLGNFGFRLPNMFYVRVQSGETTFQRHVWRLVFGLATLQPRLTSITARVFKRFVRTIGA